MLEEKRKILISPLNWGFGHAGRMIPVALSLKHRGHEVIFGADRTLISMIEPELPGINVIEIPGTEMRYSRIMPQYLAVLLHTPLLLVGALREHALLKKLISVYKPDIIISDNRFGFFNKNVFCVYVTHMLRIPFPLPFRFLEFTGILFQRFIIKHYDLCLVPDFPGTENLSGRLSHLKQHSRKVLFMGPLSRFAANTGENPDLNIQRNYICLILSGPEPQRTMLLEKVATAARIIKKQLVVLSGTEISNGVLTGDDVILILNPSTGVMKYYINNSDMVVCRSGYTTIMELLSLKKGALLIPTPGQTEQEYLGKILHGRHGFSVMRQNQITDLKSNPSTPDNAEVADNFFSMELMEKAMDKVLEQENKRKNH